MTQYAFGQTISVLGPNNGFPGTVSRFGERVIAARPFVPVTSTNNLNFGDPAVLVPNSTANAEDSYDSVADFIAAAAANIALVAQYFAGFAVREVQTQLTYEAGLQPGLQQVGFYSNGRMAEVCERGSGTILLAVGTPVSQTQLYTRCVLNSAVPAGYVGDWETGPVAASDLLTLVVGTGGAAAGQKVIPLASTTNVQAGMVVTGPGGSAGAGGTASGVPAGAYVASFVANTSITLNANLQAALAAGETITLSNLIALPFTVARTGNLDANNVLEITIKQRAAA